MTDQQKKDHISKVRAAAGRAGSVQDKIKAAHKSWTPEARKVRARKMLERIPA